MRAHNLTMQELDQLNSISGRVCIELTKRREEILTAHADPGKMADAIAKARADLAEAYVAVTEIVARPR